VRSAAKLTDQPPSRGTKRTRQTALSELDDGITADVDESVIVESPAKKQRGRPPKMPKEPEPEPLDEVRGRERKPKVLNHKLTKDTIARPTTSRGYVRKEDSSLPRLAESSQRGSSLPPISEPTAAKVRSDELVIDAVRSKSQPSKAFKSASATPLYDPGVEYTDLPNQKDWMLEAAHNPVSKAQLRVPVEGTFAGKEGETGTTAPKANARKAKAAAIGHPQGNVGNNVTMGKTSANTAATQETSNKLDAAPKTKMSMEEKLAKARASRKTKKGKGSKGEKAFANALKNQQDHDSNVKEAPTAIPGKGNALGDDQETGGLGDDTTMLIEDSTKEGEVHTGAIANTQEGVGRQKGTDPADDTGYCADGEESHVATSANLIDQVSGQACASRMPQPSFERPAQQAATIPYPRLNLIDQLAGTEAHSPPHFATDPLLSDLEGILAMPRIPHAKKRFFSPPSTRAGEDGFSDHERYEGDYPMDGLVNPLASPSNPYFQKTPTSSPKTSSEPFGGAQNVHSAGDYL